MSPRPAIAAHAVLAACLGLLAHCGAFAAPATAPAEKPPAKGAAAQPAASAPAPPSIDPMERLRLRLAQRLGGAASAADTGAVDLRLTARSSVPGKTAPAAAPPAAAVASKGSAAAPVAPRKAALAAAASGSTRVPGGPPWGYEGPAGPATWGGLRPEFTFCANGQRQSPIDIRGGLPVDLDPVRFEYQPSRFAVIDNGHTVQVNLPPGNAIEVGGKRFELTQFHFHRPSEEHIDGRQFAMSLHLVHKDAQGRMAVLAVLLDKGPAHPAVQMVWNNLPLERHEEVAARAQINPADLLPTDRRYYTFMGSMTTPPCSEGVMWVVMRTPVTLTPEQIELFARLYPMNSRPLQSAQGRRILQSH